MLGVLAGMVLLLPHLYRERVQETGVLRFLTQPDGAIGTRDVPTFLFLREGNVPVHEEDGVTFLRAEVGDAAEYDGFGLLTNLDVPEDTQLRLRWRMSDSVPEMRVELTFRDRASGREHLFIRDMRGPSTGWVWQELPLEDFLSTGEPNALQAYEVVRETCVLAGIRFILPPPQTPVVCDVAEVALVQRLPASPFPMAGLALGGGVLLVLGASLAIGPRPLRSVKTQAREYPDGMPETVHVRQAAGGRGLERADDAAGRHDRGAGGVRRGIRGAGDAPARAT